MNKEENTNPPDFYLENGFRVWTETFLERRGYCCGSGCRHCPYTPKHKKGGTELKKPPIQFVNKL
jgi:hypothetical protein